MGLAWLGIFVPAGWWLVSLKQPPNVSLPTQGVPGCSKNSSRRVVVPAGATVAFSCPVHVGISSMDEDVNAVLVLSRK
jgi:hypothetical protein